MGPLLPDAPRTRDADNGWIGYVFVLHGTREKHPNGEATSRRSCRDPVSIDVRSGGAMHGGSGKRSPNGGISPVNSRMVVPDTGGEGDVAFTRGDRRVDTDAFDRIAKRLASVGTENVFRRAAIAAVAAILAGDANAEASRESKRKKPGMKLCHNGRGTFGGECFVPCIEATRCPADPFTVSCRAALGGRRSFCGDLGASLSDVCELDYRLCSSDADCHQGQVCLPTACLPRCMDVV